MTSEQQTLILGGTATTDSSQKQRQSDTTADGLSGLSLYTGTDAEPDSSSCATTDFDDGVIFQLGRAQSTASIGGDEVANRCSIALKSKRPAPEGRKASTVAKVKDVSDEDCIFRIVRRPSSAAPPQRRRHLTEAQTSHGNGQEILLLCDEFITSSLTSNRTAPHSATTTTVNEATADESTTDESEQSIRLSTSSVSSAPGQSKEEQSLPADVISRSEMLPGQAEETVTASSASTTGVPPWSIGVSEYAASVSPGDALWKFKGNVEPQMMASGQRRQKIESTDDAMLIFGQNWESSTVAAANSNYSSERISEESEEVITRRVRLVPAVSSGAEKTDELTPRKVALHLPDQESRGVSAPPDRPHAPEMETAKARSRRAEAAAQLITMEFVPPSTSSKETSLRTSETLADCRDQMKDSLGTREPLPESPKTTTVRVDSKNNDSFGGHPDDGRRLRPHESSEPCPTCQVYATLSLVNSTSACCSQQPPLKTRQLPKFTLPFRIAKNRRLGRPKSSTKLETALEPPQPLPNLQADASHSGQKSFRRDGTFNSGEAQKPNLGEPPRQAVWSSTSLPSSASEDAGMKEAAEDSNDRRRQIPGGDGSVKKSKRGSRSRSKKESQLNSTRTTKRRLSRALPFVGEVTAKQPGRKSHSRQKSFSLLDKTLVLNASQANNGDQKVHPSGRHAAPLDPRRSRSSAAKIQAPAASSTAAAPPTSGRADRASEPRRSRTKEIIAYLVKRQPSGRTVAQSPTDPSLSGSGWLLSPSYIRDQSSSGDAQEAVALCTANRSPKPSMSMSKVGEEQPINTGSVGILAPSVTERPPRRSRMDNDVGSKARSKDSHVKLPAESFKADSKRPQLRLPRPPPPRDFITPPGSNRPPPSSRPAARDLELSALPDPVRSCSAQRLMSSSQPQVGRSFSAARSHSLLQALQQRSQLPGCQTQKQQVANGSGASSSVQDEMTSGASKAWWDYELLEVTSETEERTMQCDGV